jgi:23S rRNA (cytidine1920-2'-O)/16S rRNA (cytidine1409-2'-O)-methyltransferase
VSKERIDKLLVERGLVETRQKAQALILAGQILADNQRIDKVGHKVDINSELRIKGEQLRYVSRAGLKLEAALKEFLIDPGNKICLDVGASTGGFTDCLLQHGARHVVALDVGHAQLAWRLRQDSRVEVREGINARFIELSDFSQPFDIITIDVSFISLTKVLPSLVPLLNPSGHLITLIKPQFEVGKGEVGKGGIVIDSAKHQRVISEISDFAIEIGLIKQGLIESPIKGAEGNREFLAHFTLNHSI